MTLERLRAGLADRYRLERELGAGGMATVYLAEDLRHKRKVAVKVLKPDLAAVLGAERFIQEITTTASLQHPHILPLFDSGKTAGGEGGREFLYYVMPFIEGETIRDKLNRETQFGVEEAVRIAREVADALDYAHRRGVIHRDIKPENILLHDGRALVMDFGIALAVSAAAGGRMTETGLSLGTPHYMSPEQATADKAITGRSDVYSLASVLYEMLTGEPPHMGTSAQAIIMKIIAEPVRPAGELRKSIPANVAAALSQALEKLPADRFESAKAFGDALASPAFALPTGSAARNPAAGRAWHAGWRGRAALLVSGGLIGWLARPAPPLAVGPLARVSVSLPEGYLMGDGIDPALAISRDGATIAYLTNGGVYKRALDRDTTVRLGDAPVSASNPVFSRDGRWILFSVGGESLNAAMSIDGGPMVDATTRVLDEDLVFGTYRETISRRQAGDTIWRTVIRSDSAGTEGGIGWPQLLPDRRTMLFTRFGPDLMVNGAAVVALDLKTGTRSTVAERATYGRYLNSGHVVYATADGILEAVGFDLKRRQVSGSPVVVADGVRVAYWGGAADYGISENGTLAYVRGSNWALHQMVGLDRAGNVVQRIGKPGTFEALSLAPDGREVVLYVASNNADISRMNLATGELRRLTFEPVTEDNPVYSPDGRRIAYRKVLAARDHRVYAQAIDGGGELTQLYRDEQANLPRDWAPDGRTLALWAPPSRLLLVDIERGGVDTVSTRASREGGKFSPDGRWFAWVSEETGEHEVYVASIPGLRGKQQVSTRGGRHPRWSARSGELFFLAGDTVMVSRVSTGATFAHTPSRPLFSTLPGAMSRHGFVVSADGQRFYYGAPNPEATAHEIRLVQNLPEMLKQKAPQ